MSPISSRKSVPPSACSKRPIALPVGAGEGAPLVAEQLALEQRLGQRRAVDRARTAPSPRALAVVDGPRRPAPCRCRSRPVMRMLELVGATLAIVS